METAQQENKGPTVKKVAIPMGIRVQSSTLLKKHTEPDGWDAVLLRATLEPLPEFDASTFVWDVLKKHGGMYWKDHGHAKHMAGMVDGADVRKDGKVDLHLYLDLQQKAAQELYKALIEQQPLQFTMPGKARLAEDGSTEKAVSGSLVFAPFEDAADGQPVQYDTSLELRQKLAEVAEKMEAEKWAEELDLPPDEQVKKALSSGEEEPSLADLLAWAHSLPDVEATA